VVDDEIINFERMFNALTKEDYKVLRASGYWSGISAFRMNSGCLGLLVTAVSFPDGPVANEPRPFWRSIRT
jgi:hypothetical protein